MKLLSRWAREFLSATDQPATIVRHLEAAMGEQRAVGAPRPPDASLRLLLVGYSGMGNVGADVRVAELVRHLQHLLGGDRVGLELLTIGDRVSAAGLPPGVRALGFDGYFPEVLAGATAAADGTVVCEGSVFKSNFSDLLALLLVGAMALSSAAGRMSVAWGAEAGSMDDLLRGFVGRHGGDSLVITRNAPSAEVLSSLPLRTFPGADPAWTYRPAPPGRGAEVLGAAGWDGSTPVVCVCPVNPFWFPVEADVRRAMALARTGERSDDHFGGIFFHHRSESAVAGYEAYLDGLAVAVATATARRGACTVIVGMEPGDRGACLDLATRLPGTPAVVLADDHTAPEVVSVLRRADLIVSSRYHALLLAMPALVPLVGVHADERIPNLLAELGRPDLAVEARGAELAERILAAVEAADRDAEALRVAQTAEVAAQIRRIGDAGGAFLAEVGRRFPQHASRAEVGWDRLVPPLDPLLEALMASGT